MPTRRQFLGSATAALPLASVATSGAVAAQTVSTPPDSSFDPWVEVQAANVRHNVSEIRRRVENRPVLAVIKNNGYGAGVVNIARVLESLEGIAGFAVVKLHEAHGLRDAGIRAPVLLMGPYEERELDALVARDIAPMVYRPFGAAFDRVASVRQRPAAIHVCVDTGIGRVGVPHREAAPLITDLARRDSIRIEGTMMTFTEDPDFDRVQLERFSSLCGSLEGQGVKLGRKHSASSFALFERPAAFLDMVRPGMAIFGIYSEPPFRTMGILSLRPCLALKARVVYVKQLQAGDSAGYNRAYMAKAPVWIATLPVGHVDGVPRGLVNGGRVRIGGALYPFVGTVSASHSLVEIGPERKVEIGDEATIFDWQDGSRPEDLGEATKTSVYDLAMHLNPSLPRRVI